MNKNEYKFKMIKFTGLFLFMINCSISFAQTVEFRVDLGVQAYKGLFNPATDAVKISGNFNGWNNGSDVLTDPDGDTIYTITKTFSLYDNLIFKFIKGTEDWERDPNREYIVPSGVTEYFDYFNREYLYTSNVSVQITFACDMEYEINSGSFNPASDTLSLRGSFNGWSDEWIMTPTIESNIYAITKPFLTYAGEVFNYKFVYKTISDTVWENDPNKTIAITAEQIYSGIALVIRLFNYVTGPSFYPACKIKISVNMNDAVSSINLQPFSDISDVRICGDKFPLRWPNSGWPDSDSILATKLYDDGTNGDLIPNDNVWTKDIKFPLYLPYRVTYKYSANWGKPTNNGGNNNESVQGNYHSFDVPDNILRASVNNSFGSMGVHPLADMVLLDVKTEPRILVNNQNLEQNYPNPFNPTTKIRYTIPTTPASLPLLKKEGIERWFITLKVFDMLGTEVETLVSDYKPPGNYEVEFIIKGNLPSGVYFYQLKTGDIFLTKKMIFLK